MGFITFEFSLVNLIIPTVITGITIAVCYLFLNPKLLVLFVSRLMKLFGGFKEKQIKPINTKITFSYIERGWPSPSHPTIVFVHGFSASKELFIDTSKSLPSHYHIVSVDLPGHCHTSVDDTPEDVGIQYFVDELKKFIESIGLGCHTNRKFNLVGESMGGHIVGNYSYRYPNDLASVTMICPHGIRFDQAEVHREMLFKTGKHFLLPTDMEGGKELMTYLTHKQRYIPHVIQKGLLLLRLVKIDFYKQLLTNLLTPPNIFMLEETIGNIQVPAMLLWGKLDRILDVSCVETIKRKLPKLKECVVFENTGHTLTMECPDKVASNLLEFINGI